LESIQVSQAQQPAVELTHSPSPTSTREPTPSSHRPELITAQFQILTDQLFAPESVYQERGFRIERSKSRLKVSIDDVETDIQKPENLAPIVNHLQTLLNEFQLLSLYEEFLEAARLEKSIRDKAAEMIQLNQGDYFGATNLTRDTLQCQGSSHC